MFRKRATANGEIDEPELPGDNLMVAMGLNYVAFYGETATEKIKAETDSAVMVEDWC